MEKVIAYLRVSTEQQDLERQRKQVVSYCKCNKYNLIEIIEEKVSGAKTERKGLLKLLSKTKDDGDLVIVSEQSRFSREKNIVKVLTNISSVLENGLDLIFLDNPNKIYKAGTEIEFADLVMLMAGAYASNIEREKITYRMQSGKEALFYSHPYASIHSTIPFGFRIVPNQEYIQNKDNNKKYVKNLLEPDEKQVALLKNMFDLYVNGGKSYVDLKHYLFDNGYNFDVTAIPYMLRNKLYIGERYYKGVLVHKIEPLIDKDLFNKVPFVAKSNMIYPDKSPYHINPFKGIIKCRCGASLMMKVRRNEFQYICYSRKNKLYNCDNFGISMNLLRLIGLNCVYVMNVKPNYSEETNKLLNSYKDDIVRINDIIDNLNNELTLCNKRINNLLDAIADESDKETTTALKNKIKDVNVEISQIKKDIKTQNNNKYKLSEAIKNLSNNINYNNLTDLDLKDIIRRIIDKMVYSSFSASYGVCIVYYKNGIQSTYYVDKRNAYRSGAIFMLPDSFKYNSETMLFETEVMVSQDTVNFDMTNMFEKRCYNYKELKKYYNMDEWVINMQNT